MEERQGGAYVRPDATNLGLPEKTLDEIIDLARQVRAEWGFAYVASFAAGLFDISTDPAKQFALVLRHFPGIALRFAGFARRHQHQQPVLFSEQQLFIAQRLLLVHGKDGSLDNNPSEAEIEALAQLILYGNDIESQATPFDQSRPPSLEEGVAYILQSASYSGRPHLANAIARTDALLVRHEEARADERLPLDKWSQDAYGLSLNDQLAGGFAAAAVLNAWSPSEGRIALPDDLFDIPGLGGKKAALIDALSATRDEYRTLFNQGKGDLLDLAWEITPFLQKPFLRASNGTLYLTSPRCLTTWLYDGFFHRLLQRAQCEGEGT